MRWAARAAIALLVCGGGAVGAIGCYSPSIDNGSLHCGSGKACPSGFFCASDDHCWRNGTGPGGAAGDMSGGGGGVEGGGGGAIDLGSGGAGGGDMASGDMATAPDMVSVSPPGEPAFTSTSPASPSTNTMPSILGIAASGSTVKLYTNTTCTGNPVATGTAGAFANPGLVVTVAADATTTFRATASNGAGTSACSASIISYTHASIPPAPTVINTVPASPSNSTTNITVAGTAAANTTVSIYSNASCSGPPLASGTDAVFGATGIAVTVKANVSTDLYANATSATGTGPCSTTFVNFVNDSVPPDSSQALVVDGVSGQNLAWSTSASAAKMHWSGFSDLLTNVVKYNVAVGGDAGCTTIVGASVVMAPALSATVSTTTLNEGQKYYSCVAAVDGAGNAAAYLASDGFTIDTLPPTMPGSLMVTPTSGGKATITWAASSDPGGNPSGVLGYDVAWCAGTSCTPVVQSSNVAPTSYTATGLSPCTTYTFAVVARDNAGNVSAAATASALEPLVAGSLTVVPGAGTVEYSLSSVSGATSYDFCYGANATPCTSGTMITSARLASFVKITDPTVRYYAMNVNAPGCQATTADVLAPQFTMRALYANPIQGSGAGAQLGAAVGIIGDLNADGKADLVAGSIGTRQTFAYSGPSGASIWSPAATSNTLGPFGDSFGNGIGVGGDIDGDGVPDVVIGAITAATSGNVNQGQFYVFAGGATPKLLFGPSTLTSTVPTTGQLVGLDNTIVGDLDGDGNAEFIVCGPGDASSVAGFCDVYKLIVGAPNTVLSIAHLGGSSAVTDRFGSAVATIGDIDNDNIPDFAIGASHAGANHTGTIYLYSGKTQTLIRTFDTSIPAGSFLGDAIAGVGDVNADGVPDFVAAGYFQSPGRAIVFSGKDGSILYNQAGFNTASPDNFGYTVAAAGDVDGDGYADWAVGAPRAKTPGGTSDAGLVYVFSGADGSRIYQFEGSAGAELGTTLAGGADVNGDGRPDLVAATQFWSCGGNANCGEVQVFSALDELRWSSPSESMDPLGRQGWGAAFLPRFTSGASIVLAAQGGSGGYSFSVPFNSSRNSIVAGVNYSPVGTKQCDTLRVTDSAKRSFDTRDIIGTPPAAGSIPNRPTSLTASAGSSSGALALHWVDGAATGNAVIEFRGATQAWITAATIPVGTGQFTFNGTPDTPYKLRVKSEIPSLCDSAWSNEVTAITKP